MIAAAMCAPPGCRMSVGAGSHTHRTRRPVLAGAIVALRVTSASAHAAETTVTVETWPPAPS